MKSIAILDGDVTQAGLVFLKKLKDLESISINTRSVDRIVTPCAATYFPGIDCNIALYDTVLREQDKSSR